MIHRFSRHVYSLCQGCHCNCVTTQTFEGRIVLSLLYSTTNVGRAVEGWVGWGVGGKGGAALGQARSPLRAPYCKTLIACDVTCKVFGAPRISPCTQPTDVQ